MQPTLGENIRQARKTYGMNQTVLAQRVGISKTSLSLIESGETKDPHFSIVRKIAELLHISLDELAGFPDDWAAYRWQDDPHA
jgi:transcriptional regulator with XRE-family HTH domain